VIKGKAMKGQVLPLVLCISAAGMAMTGRSYAGVELSDSRQPQVAIEQDASVHGGVPTDRNIRRHDLRRKADAVRATSQELKFQRIPWITDLFEGFRLAEMEHRPVFLYLITGDPLADC
jgi:hypothetical protein